MNVEQQLERVARHPFDESELRTVGWDHIVQRAHTVHQRRRRRRAGGLGVALAVVAATVYGVVATQGNDHRPVVVSPTPSTSPSARATGADPTGWRVFGQGSLSPRSGAVEVWTGRELIVWGGSVGGESRATNDGAAFDPASGTWRRIAPAPLSARQDAIGIWTGSRLVVAAGTNGTAHLTDGAAYDPTTNSWKRIAALPAPDAGAIDPRLAVWTGREILVAPSGLAYDPVADHWSVGISVAPYGVTLQAAVWTGHVMIVLGPRSATSGGRSPVEGFEYDPSSGRRRTLPTSGMESSAISATWDGTRVVVVSYDMLATSYRPATGAWTSLPRIPLRFYECYSYAFTIAGHAYAQTCAGIAELDDASRWEPVAYPIGQSGPGAGVAAGDAALFWGSTYATGDSRFAAMPTSAYFPGSDARHLVLAGAATTALEDSDRAEAYNAVATPVGEAVTAQVSTAIGACTVTATDGGTQDWAAGEVARLAATPGATRRTPPAGSHGAPYALSFAADARLVWAISTNDTVDIRCAQAGTTDRLVRATHLVVTH